MIKIFINYRRSDSEGYAGRIYDHLLHWFDRDEIFFDIKKILIGSVFSKEIEDAISECGLMLAIIGPTWEDILDSKGNRRIENEDDFVRHEISLALQKGIPILPVCIRETLMPNPSNLPENIANICQINAAQISHKNFEDDVERVAHRIAEILELSKVIVTFKKARWRTPIELTFDSESKRKYDIVKVGTQQKIYFLDPSDYIMEAGIAIAASNQLVLKLKSKTIKNILCKVNDNNATDQTARKFVERVLKTIAGEFIKLEELDDYTEDI